MGKMKCYFCNREVDWQPLTNFHAVNSVTCEICGYYIIARNTAFEHKLDETNRPLLNCIRENIQMKKEERIPIWFENEEIANKADKKLFENRAPKYFDYINMQPIPHADKPPNILKLLAQKLEGRHPFDKVGLEKVDLYSLLIKDEYEAVNWIGTLVESGLIKSDDFDKLYKEDKNPKHHIESLGVFLEDNMRLTNRGWHEIEKNLKSVVSSKAFIAYRFKWPEEDNIKDEMIEAARKACQTCGFEANPVNPHHTGQITDRIIADIKSSRFVIADFTYNNHGVYYEAGFARGLGIPVIHTVKKGHVDGLEEKLKKMHFDIKQINYIEWETTKDLEQKLKDRIEAVIK